MLRVQWSFLPWEDAGACLLLMYFFRFPSSLALYLAFHAHRHIFSTICAHLGVFPLKDIEQSAVTHSLCWKKYHRSKHTKISMKSAVLLYCSVLNVICAANALVPFKGHPFLDRSREHWRNSDNGCHAWQEWEQGCFVLWVGSCLHQICSIGVL